MAGFAAVFAVLTTAAVVGSASARFVVEKSAVKVIRPEHIRGRHDAALANFGVPNYGGTMVGVVKYQVNSTACNAFDGEPFKTGASRRPAILLVDRGDCYFALKAWNAQQAGAAAVLVADNIDEPLLTMDNPEESQDTEYVDKINIPAALINREFGAALKKALAKRDELVIVKLDWRESMPHPDERVEYEFWTNSNDECGPRCDDQMSFVKNFKGHAQLLERGGFTQFTPRYITWFCPDAFLLSKQCKAQCINKGRYCAPDPEQDFGEGYDGKDVVIENLRQLCIHRVGNETGRPWVWWDFVTDFHVRCSMKNKNYSRDCAEEVVKSLGKSIDLIISSTILKERHFLMLLTLMYQVCPCPMQAVIHLHLLLSCPRKAGPSLMVDAPSRPIHFPPRLSEETSRNSHRHALISTCLVFAITPPVTRRQPQFQMPGYIYLKASFAFSFSTKFSLH